ncbi:hypothetical protein D3C78_1224090 [compost metagenome]
MLVAVEQGQLAQRALWPFEQVSQQVLPVAGQALNTGRLEQGAVVFEAGLEVARAVGDVQRQVEFGFLLTQREEFQRQVNKTQRALFAGVDTPIEQGLEQRVGLAATLQLQVLEDQLHGVVGMLQGGQRLLA